MGLLSKTFGALKKVGQKIVETGKKIINKTGKSIAKAYSKFTGKEKFEQAKILYEELKQRMELAKQDYDTFIGKTVNSIELQVNTINDMKSGLNKKHFHRFVRIANRISNWEIILKELPEQFHYSEIEVESIAERDGLFLIDFDKNPIKNNLIALCFFGLGSFWTRKKATETLHKVQEQEKVLQHELAKMDVEKKRIAVVLDSLRNAATYFRDLTELYSGILDELEYTVNLVANAGHISSPTFKDHKVDCYLFPNQHLLCLMAADKMTRILFEMTTLRYLSREGELIESDQVTIKVKKRAIEAIADKLAA